MDYGDRAWDFEIQRWNTQGEKGVCFGIRHRYRVEEMVMHECRLVCSHGYPVGPASEMK